MRPTKAQLQFLRMHKGDEVLVRYLGNKTYDFVGRCRDAGLIEIVEKPGRDWPWAWLGTKLTAAGRAVMEAHGA